MKVLAAVLVVLSTGSIVFSQNAKNPGARTNKGGPPHTSAYKSTNSDVVAATLKRNSSTASNLAQIERQNKLQVGRASAHATTTASLPKAYVAAPGKNKPIRASYKSPKAGGAAKSH